MVGKKQRCHKDMEVPGRHRGDGRTMMCWKDTEVQIRKDGELLKSSWAAYWRAHSIR